MGCNRGHGSAEILRTTLAITSWTGLVGVALSVAIGLAASSSAQVLPTIIVSGALNLLWLTREPTSGILIQGGRFAYAGTLDAVRGVLLLLSSALGWLFEVSYLGYSVLFALGCGVVVILSVLLSWGVKVTEVAAPTQFSYPWRQGLSLGASRTVEVGFATVDQMMLGPAVTAPIFGSYSLASRTVWAGVLVPATMTDLVRRELYTTESRQLRRALSSTLRRTVPSAVAAAVCIAGGAWAAADRLFPDYPQTGWYAVCLSVVPVARSVAIPCGAGLIGAGLQSLRFRIQTVLLVAYAVGLFLAVPRLGAPGAIYMTLLIEVLLAFFLARSVYRFLREDDLPGAKLGEVDAA